MDNNKKKKPKPFQIPEAFFRQLDEMSSGGFCLFTFDEQGNPQIFSKFDSVHHAAHMHKHIGIWNKAIDSLDLDITMHCLLNRGRRKS